MNTKEFVERFSVQSRLMCGGPLDGIELHVCQVGARYFNAVQDIHEGWVTVFPRHSYFAASNFMWTGDRELAEALMVAA